jgi:hypothetical protein
MRASPRRHHLQRIVHSNAHSLPPPRRADSSLYPPHVFLVPLFCQIQGFGTLLSNLGAQRGMPPAPIDTFKPGVGQAVQVESSVDP